MPPTMTSCEERGEGDRLLGGEKLIKSFFGMEILNTPFSSSSSSESSSPLARSAVVPLSVPLRE